MGHFSFTKADSLTKTANIVMEAPAKCLVPYEFGGAAETIRGTYDGFGRLVQKGNDAPAYDMHELMALWNADMPLTEACVRHLGLHGDTSSVSVGAPVRESLRYTGSFPMLKMADGDTDWNRSIGIALEHEAEEGTIRLAYPLKLVSASYTGDYERCPGASISDPDQGITPLLRTKIGHYPYDKGSVFYKRFQIAMGYEAANKRVRELRAQTATEALKNICVALNGTSYTLDLVLGKGKDLLAYAHYNDEGLIFKPLEWASSAHTISSWTFNLGRDLLPHLENGYEIAWMSIGTHFSIWEELHRASADESPHQLALRKYLAFCKRTGVTEDMVKNSHGDE